MMNKWLDIGLHIRYMFVPESMNYFDAAENCRDNKGQLFEPRSAEVQLHLNDIVERQLREWTSYWIGINDFLLEESARGRQGTGYMLANKSSHLLLCCL